MSKRELRAAKLFCARIFAEMQEEQARLANPPSVEIVKITPKCPALCGCKQGVMNIHQQTGPEHFWWIIECGECGATWASPNDGWGQT